ncbi:hypothetical protein MRX96_032197 [Rhipicephalus microplus]
MMSACANSRADVLCGFLGGPMTPRRTIPLRRLNNGSPEPLAADEQGGGGKRNASRLQVCQGWMPASALSHDARAQHSASLRRRRWHDELFRAAAAAAR